MSIRSGYDGGRDGVKPRRASHGAMYSDWWLSSDGTTMAHFISIWCGVRNWTRSRTVNIDLVVTHQLAQMRKPLGRHDSLHIGSGSPCESRMEGPFVEGRNYTSIGCFARGVGGAREKAHELHA